jgi:2'-hydroxyisoflavone reductase
MALDRRRFLKTTLAAGGAAALGLGAGGRVAGAFGAHPPQQSPGAPGETGAQADRPMKILILGGTSFLGPHQIHAALDRGHEISIFTRGKTHPRILVDDFERVEKLVGDREGDLGALENRSWDAVLDNSGQRVEWATATAQLLKDAAHTYLYVSSTGVYYPYLTTNLSEETQPLLADDPPGEKPSYGVMKALSELEVQQAFGERALVVRPQYIVGPGDRMDRFAYWPLRLTRGGEVLVPGNKSDAIMYIDVRDLAEWMIDLVERQVGGVFNAAGPASALTMEQFVYGVRGATSSPVSFTWIEDYDFLKEHEYTWNIPWVLPTDDLLGCASINIDRALAEGLTFRPLARTCADVHEWWYSDAVDEERRASPEFPVDADRERELLEAWKS